MVLKKTSVFIIIILIFIYLFILTSLIYGVENKPFRINPPSNCFSNECSSSIIERHKKENYDLAFVEFSERGNVFSRERLKEVINYIKKEEMKNKSGIMLIVYTHGWRHNASNIKSGNVEKFRKLLKIISKNELLGKKVIGLYIGWRGLSLDFDPFNTLTYWDRKNTARQVGTGGVSELLLKLNKITSENDNDNKNIFVISGHSFGAAVILSAMKDILISRVINTDNVASKYCMVKKNFKQYCSKGCYKTKPFGDGIILINPAVEANELLQLKEIVTEERCYSQNQVKLLHILSSNSDISTNYFFKIGQYLGVSLNNSEKILKRKIFIGDTSNKRYIELNERDLDIIAVGNYSPFITGRSRSEKEQKENRCKEVYTEKYDQCHGNGRCVDDKYKKENFPVSPYEPISIVSTDAPFINSHTDVFNENIVAYMSSAVLENQYKNNNKVLNNKNIRENCFEKKENNYKFNFKICMAFFKRLYIKDFCQEFNYSE
jgi:hypothetical protein